jgi:hypothetical protein
MREQAAVAARVAVRHPGVRARPVIRRIVAHRRHRAMHPRYRMASTTLGERLRNSRRERCHQDREQSEQAANFVRETTEHLPGGLV